MGGGGHLHGGEDSGGGVGGYMEVKTVVGEGGFTWR